MGNCLPCAVLLCQEDKPAIAYPAPDSGEWKPVMGRYFMDMSRDGLMGAGTSSICRKGKDAATKDAVAIKVYKTSTSVSSKEDKSTLLMKFRRQVAVLKHLQEPFVKPEDARLWCPHLDKAKPSRLFMCLLDYSRDREGMPNLDARDGILYLVSELARYSLKDYLAYHKKGHEPLTKDTVRDLTKALLLVMAGLHAKGLVHLDIKPENLMVFDGCLKLIDVDGCIKIGVAISINDPSISFSPCYCAPEWAKFLVEDGDDNSITADGALDCWSVGCTICEFVTLKSILIPQYAKFSKHGKNSKEAAFLFMDWLSNIEKPPTPSKIQDFDTDLHTLVSDMLLVRKNVRKTCAECLKESSYLTKAKFLRSLTNPLNEEADDDSEIMEMPADKKRRHKHLLPDHSGKAIYKGMLWKLNNGKDPHDPAQWLARDMWIANNRSLCYYSKAEEKRLVMLDAHKLQTAKITRVSGLAKDNAFQIECDSEDDAGKLFVFAGRNSEESDAWYEYLGLVSKMDIMPTMRLGASIVSDLNAFRCEVKNRRMKIENDHEHLFEPVFKQQLWKVKAAGDPTRGEDWFQRETWLSRNGSLVYWSVREQRELVYYTSADIHRANIVKFESNADPSTSFKQWSFLVMLSPIDDGMAIAPGQFAADTEEMREKWIQELLKFK
jgi:serine/threonine protein kinase